MLVNPIKGSTANRHQLFEEWLELVGAEVQMVERGTFKEAGTNVGACIIIIDKK